MEFLKQLTVWQKRILASFVGGIAGFAYYYYIGCVSGTCAITSDPYISTGYGMLIAALLINDTSKKKENRNGNEHSTASKEI